MTGILRIIRRKKIQILIEKGDKSAAAGGYDRAIGDFTKALQLDSRNTSAYNSRGFTCAEKGEYDKAIEDFSRVLRLDPRYSIAYYNRGMVYRLKEEHDKAVEDQIKYFELEPGSKVSRKVFDVSTNHGMGLLPDDTTECPFCDETVKSGAPVCTFCAREIPSSARK